MFGTAYPGESLSGSLVEELTSLYMCLPAVVGILRKILGKCLGGKGCSEVSWSESHVTRLGQGGCCGLCINRDRSVVWV